ncbi:AUGMIN subunit 3-like [Telopea speciosissima]|uniref:AUGMIN subunit 3-like n=1 Tax=Telopea speciosissima TaxID=54955 RepID=UPI001CC386AD|nr:AUGMIN subunit 3-like [Telopea speciosissima]
MNGSRLCSLLGELGYEGREVSDPDSFEWPFQYEEAHPLLEWICSSLRPTNVLSGTDVSQYEQFLKEGKLLEGDDLDCAYDSILPFSSRRDDQDTVFGAEEGLKDIQDATLAYKTEALDLQKQLKNLQCQYDLLTGHASPLIQGRRSRVTATSTVNGKLAVIDDGLSARNLEMNALLGMIISTAQELSHYLSGDEDSIYLAYSDFSSFLLQDSSCSKELNQWFVKQFETGPFQLVAKDGKAKSSWLSLEEFSDSGVQNSEKSCHQHGAELQRLRTVFGTSERHWVEAQVENAKQQAILAVIKSQIALDEAHIHVDLHSLRRRHSDLTRELSNLYQKLNLLSETIPDRCWELARLQEAYISQGDYELKVIHQEAYTGRQKVFIQHLINQLAGNQFLKIACQLQQKTMLSAYSLLKVIESELHGYLSATNSRTSCCQLLIQAASEEHERGAVNDQDTFLHGVRDLVSILSRAQGGLSTYVSAPGIVQQISSLHSDLVTLQSELENSLPEDRNKCIIDLCTHIQSLQQLVFAFSTTAQPILTAWPLMRELVEMENINTQLSAAVEEVTREHREKAEIIKHHPHEVGRERQVFVDFVCNPERLRNQVRELSSKVNARQV